MTTPAIPFDNTYARLPAAFQTPTRPTPVANPTLIHLNMALALDLHLDPASLASPAGVAILAGNAIAPGSQPIASAYAGHQFGHFVPQLGDGRAILLGEVLARDGIRYDIQLKGAGPTPYSRRGDGRAALGPVLREYLLSEAMHALGVPTTRALAAVATGQPVFRETMQPGAIFTRVASSHLRVGTFQFFAARRDTASLRILADYAIARHYPEAAQAPEPYRAFLDGVIARQAALVAQWLSLGFIHGVMNTDNTSISGETIDYGPCAFLEAYEPDKVFSSIDHQGRYAYSNQPHAMHWNLTRLAESLLPLLIEEAGSEEAALTSANQSLAAFIPVFASARATQFRRKIGLSTQHEADQALIDSLLNLMAGNQADFTQTFRRLSEAAENPAHDEQVATLFRNPADFHTWATTWHQRLTLETNPTQQIAADMRQLNPAIIPRNHLVQAVIEAAVDHNNLQPFRDLLSAVTRPYQPHAVYQTPARPDQHVLQTFCGT